MFCPFSAKLKAPCPHSRPQFPHLQRDSSRGCGQDPRYLDPKANEAFPGASEKEKAVYTHVQFTPIHPHATALWSACPRLQGLGCWASGKQMRPCMAWVSPLLYTLPRSTACHQAAGTGGLRAPQSPASLFPPAPGRLRQEDDLCSQSSF